MKNFINKAYYNLDEKYYQRIVMFIVPLMNFLSGLVIDVCAPSMPNMVHALHASMPSVKNTITAVLLGCAVGAPVAGGVFDRFGRRRILIIFLLIFIGSSVLAIYATNIMQIIVVRFIQGIAAVAMSVGTRTIMADHFDGKEFTIGLLYISLAYGVGMVIAPYIGGYLQHYFGWHASFYLLLILGCICLTVFILFIHERFNKPIDYHVLAMIKSYILILQNKTFISSTIIGSVLQFEMVLYPAIGPFLVEHQLHGNAITYGKSSLIIAGSYMLGTLTSRVCVSRLSPKGLMNIGFVISILAVMLQLWITLQFDLCLWGVVLPIAMISYAAGFFFINLYAACMRLFPENIGVVFSSQMCIMMLSAAILLFLLSHLTISTMGAVFSIFLCAVVIKLVMYLMYFQRAL